MTIATATMTPLDLLQLGAQLRKSAPTGVITWAKVGKSRSGNSTTVLLMSYCPHNPGAVSPNLDGSIIDIGNVYVPNNRGITIYRYLGCKICPDPYWTMQINTHELHTTLARLERLPVSNLTAMELARWEAAPRELKFNQLLYPFKVKELF